MKKCIKCNFELNDNAKFCPECDEKQEIEYNSCGASVDSGSKFRSEPGARIGLQKTEVRERKEKIDINPSTDDNSNCEVNIQEIFASIGSENIGQLDIKINVTNHGCQSWQWLGVAAYLFDDTGAFIQNENFEDEDGVKENESKDISLTLSDIVLPGAANYAHSGHIVVVAKAREQNLVRFKSIQISKLSNERISLQPSEECSSLKVIEANFVAEMQNETDECKVQLNLIVQSSEVSWIPRVKAQAKIIDIEGNCLTELEESGSIEPEDLLLLSTYGYLENDVINGSKIEVSLAVEMPDSQSNAQMRFVYHNDGHAIALNRENDYDEQDSLGDDVVKISCKELVYSTFEYDADEFMDLDVYSELEKWIDNLENESISAPIYEGSSLEADGPSDNKVVIDDQSADPNSVTVVAYYYYQDAEYTADRRIDDKININAISSISRLKSDEKKFFGTAIDSLEMEGEQFYIESQSASAGTKKSVAFFKGEYFILECEVGDYSKKLATAVTRKIAAHFPKSSDSDRKIL